MTKTAQKHIDSVRFSIDLVHGRLIKTFLIIEHAPTHLPIDEIELLQIKNTSPAASLSKLVGLFLK